MDSSKQCVWQLLKWVRGEISDIWTWGSWLVYYKVILILSWSSPLQKQIKNRFHKFCYPPEIQNQSWSEITLDWLTSKSIGFVSGHTRICLRGNSIRTGSPLQRFLNYITWETRIWYQRSYIKNLRLKSCHKAIFSRKQYTYPFHWEDQLPDRF